MTLTKEGVVAIICAIVVFSPVLLIVLLILWIKSKITKKALWERARSDAGQLLADDARIKEKFKGWETNAFLQGLLKAHKVELLSKEHVELLTKIKNKN